MLTKPNEDLMRSALLLTDGNDDYGTRMPELRFGQPLFKGMQDT